MRLAWTGVLLVLALLAWPVTALAGEEQPGPQGSSPELPEPSQFEIKSRFSAPTLPDNPTQADLGARVYYDVCMACHGDHGQGLTDEWRALWESDSNCWQSKCHASNHPPEGFDFPKGTSPVVGADTLTRFSNAQELYIYLHDTMPWWDPQGLEDEEYWQLTAFLMRTHQALPAGVELGPGNAAVFHVRPAAPFPENPRPIALAAGGSLAFIAGLLFLSGRHAFVRKAAHSE